MAFGRDLANSAIRDPPIVNLKSEIENSSRLSKYIAVYDWTHAGLCRELRRHARLHLNSDLHRNPYRQPHAAHNRASLRKPFEKPNPALFHWLYGLKYGSLYGLVNLASYRET